MNKGSLFNKARLHYKAINIAIILLCATVYFAIPEGLNAVDLSSDDSPAAVINVNANILKLLNWEYSTHIEKINGIRNHDKLYGLPDLVIFNHGDNIIEVTCVWRILNIEWIRSLSIIEVNLAPDRVYKLISTRVSLARARDKCTVELLDVTQFDNFSADKLQSTYLKEYGF